MSYNITVDITTCPHFCDEYPLPQYETSGSAGLDVRAALESPLTIEAGKVAMVPTGLCVAVPRGFELQVRSRSGLAAKQGLFALNAPGTVDSDYRGEVKVILANFSDTDAVIQRGDRIAQFVFAKHAVAIWNAVESLDETARGSGGFGSTGKQ